MREKETKLTICDICGVKAARTVNRPQILGRGEQMLLVENVPVIACKNCGESYLTSATMHKLDALRINQNVKPTLREVSVAEFV